MRDVTIYRIYDGTHLKAPAPSALGCIAADHIQCTEVEEGKFCDVIPSAMTRGEISNEPGFYLFLEFDDNVDDFRGIVYTVDTQGTFRQGCVVPTDRVPRLHTWPPK